MDWIENNCNYVDFLQLTVCFSKETSGFGTFLYVGSITYSQPNIKKRRLLELLMLSLRRTSFHFFLAPTEEEAHCWAVAVSSLPRLLLGRFCKRKLHMWLLCEKADIHLYTSKRRATRVPEISLCNPLDIYGAQGVVKKKVWDWFGMLFIFCLGVFWCCKLNWDMNRTCEMMLTYWCCPVLDCILFLNQGGKKICQMLHI